MKKWWNKSIIKKCCGQIISGIKDVIAICRHALESIVMEAVMAACVVIISSVAGIV